MRSIRCFRFPGSGLLCTRVMVIFEMVLISLILKIWRKVRSKSYRVFTESLVFNKKYK